MEDVKQQTLKKGRLVALKCALPLLVRSNFSWGVSLCSKIQIFSVSEPPHFTLTREGSLGGDQLIDDTCWQETERKEDL